MTVNNLTMLLNKAIRKGYGDHEVVHSGSEWELPISALVLTDEKVCLTVTSSNPSEECDEYTIIEVLYELNDMEDNH